MIFFLRTAMSPRSIGVLSFMHLLNYYQRIVMYMMEYLLSQHVRNGLRKQTKLVFINKQKYSL